jgi:hypothetical protein
LSLIYGEAAGDGAASLDAHECSQERGRSAEGGDNSRAPRSRSVPAAGAVHASGRHMPPIGPAATGYYSISHRRHQPT